MVASFPFLRGVALSLCCSFGIAALPAVAVEHAEEPAAEDKLDKPATKTEKPKAAAKPEAKMEHKVEGKVEPRMDARPESRPEPMAEHPAAEAKVATKTEHTAEAKGEVKGDGKGDAKGDAKAESRTMQKADVKPMQKGEEVIEPAASEPQDPMDALRDRLAQKLSGAKVKEASNRAMLRVISNTTMSSGSVGAHEGASATGRRPSRRAAPAAEAVAGDAQHASVVHWDYVGDGGPQRWAEINPDFAKCATGQRQSPIDIRDGIKVELEPVHFDYKPSAFRVIDNGHTVQVNVAPGNSIEVMGRRFELVQFHFHRPSEERIEGRQFDMVMHLVHKDLDGRLAVIAVLLDRGSAQPIVQSIWNNLPLEKGEELAARTMLNPNDLLPLDRSYFTYMGSLTTPPCSEGVLWMVMKEPVPISAEQIGVFARLYPMNARPIQSASGRLIKQSN